VLPIETDEGELAERCADLPPAMREAAGLE
jgi:hypothetical protein